MLSMFNIASLLTISSACIYINILFYLLVFCLAMGVVCMFVFFFFFCLLQTKPIWQRTGRIMALVPPENAPSDSSSISTDDEVILEDGERM